MLFFLFSFSILLKLYGHLQSNSVYSPTPGRPWPPGRPLSDAPPCKPKSISCVPNQIELSIVVNILYHSLSLSSNNCLSSWLRISKLFFRTLISFLFFAAQNSFFLAEPFEGFQPFQGVLTCKGNNHGFLFTLYSVISIKTPKVLVFLSEESYCQQRIKNNSVIN